MNDIHGAIAIYSVSKFSTFEFCPTRCEYARLHALSSPLGGGGGGGGRRALVHTIQRRLEVLNHDSRVSVDQRCVR